ncbi:MAG: lipopolysaccharide biosynthesis protein, partial [Eubacteriaceae bacterium]
PSLLLSLVMFVLCYLILLLNLNDWITLILQILTGMVFYLGTAYLLKFECLSYLIDTVKGFRKRKLNG